MARIMPSNLPAMSWVKSRIVMFSGMWNVNCGISREMWIQFFEKWTPDLLWKAAKHKWGWHLSAALLSGFVLLSYGFDFVLGADRELRFTKNITSKQIPEYPDAVRGSPSGSVLHLAAWEKILADSGVRTEPVLLSAEHAMKPFNWDNFDKTHASMIMLMSFPTAIKMEVE